MSNDSIFETQPDYEVPLLRLLYKLPDGQGQVGEVCRLFEAEYGHLIPEEHYRNRRGNEPLWRNNVCWCRQYLKQRGFLEAPRHGIWRISEAGRHWLEENPNATSIRGGPKRSPSRSRKRSSSKATSMPGITLEMLEQTRKAMPTDQFRELWAMLYDQLLAEERAKAITKITQTELGRRARRRLDKIHDFLQGKDASTPSAEVLCDWIHFCYALELYRESAALLPYVHEGEVDAATYKRARRVADLCRSKLVG